MRDSPTSYFPYFLALYGVYVTWCKLQYIIAQPLRISFSLLISHFEFPLVIKCILAGSRQLGLRGCWWLQLLKVEREATAIMISASIARRRNYLVTESVWWRSSHFPYYYFITYKYLKSAMNVFCGFAVSRKESPNTLNLSRGSFQ